MDGRAFAAVVFIIVLVALVAESVGLLISTLTTDYDMTLSGARGPAWTCGWCVDGPSHPGTPTPPAATLSGARWPD